MQYHGQGNSSILCLHSKLSTQMAQISRCCAYGNYGRLTSIYSPRMVQFIVLSSRVWFLQSLSDPTLSLHVTSICGQILCVMESLNDFDSEVAKLQLNLTINRITHTLTAFPTALDTSISYARSNHYSILDSLDSDSSVDLQGFMSNYTSAPCSRDTKLHSRDTQSKPSACHPCKKNQNKDVVFVVAIISAISRLIVTILQSGLSSRMQSRSSQTSNTNEYSKTTIDFIQVPLPTLWLPNHAPKSFVIFVHSAVSLLTKLWTTTIGMAI